MPSQPMLLNIFFDPSRILIAKSAESNRPTEVGQLTYYRELSNPLM